VRNALDRIRLRQALRLFEERDRQLTPEDLVIIREPEVRGSRLFETVAEDSAATWTAEPEPAQAAPVAPEPAAPEAAGPAPGGSEPEASDPATGGEPTW
jgi:hypothetical protein